MNAVEIEVEVEKLAQAPFDAEAFPWEFLRAFAAKETTVKRLKKGETNRSDVAGGVCWRNNAHLAVCGEGEVAATLKRLRESPETAKQKVKYVLATDGHTVEAAYLPGDEYRACPYGELHQHFSFFLALAGISTTKAIRDSSVDIRATRRLNQLRSELLKENPTWGTAERQEDFNHFLARLIFCFFAEDTRIFADDGQFTDTAERMSESDGSNLHEVLAEVFRAMDTADAERAKAGLPSWAEAFPYVNGGLFAAREDTPEGGTVPRFSRIARAYLVEIGALDWKAINPDIFGSMIQAVADDEERGRLGMHYTSVPNILKVLNPLFLDDLRAKLEEAGDGGDRGSKTKLLNLKKRMARIRVFDPACGSGNFLVIAYKQMREIEAEIDHRRGRAGEPSALRPTNFRGIELKHFSAEVARLALIIAEYQANTLYRGEALALKEFLPLDAKNWITCGNALRLDWLALCPPTGKKAEVVAEDLLSDTGEQAERDFENEGGETYICGNPPYSGSVTQGKEQKEDLKNVFERFTKKGWKSLDYVAAWFLKAAEYSRASKSHAAFVSTNSVCQGEQVPILWPILYSLDQNITFAHQSYNWSNLASHNAGVTVVIVGISSSEPDSRLLFDVDDDGREGVREVENIGPYLVASDDLVVHPETKPLGELTRMIRGNMANDGGHLILSASEAAELRQAFPESVHMIRRYVGSREFIHSLPRHCLWIEDDQLELANSIDPISQRIANVREQRLRGGKQARGNAETPHRFVFAPHQDAPAAVVPRVSSESRPFLPVGLSNGSQVISERNFVLYDAPIWNVAVLMSRMHLIWIGTVCVRMRTDYSYSNTLGWNTFPVPTLTETNKADLTRCAEDILLAREAHFPATIADLYDPEKMPDDLRAAHDRNDETLERIYLGRRFRNDTERLEKLFAMYAEMTA